MYAGKCRPITTRGSTFYRGSVGLVQRLYYNHTSTGSGSRGSAITNARAEHHQTGLLLSLGDGSSPDVFSTPLMMKVDSV